MAILSQHPERAWRIAMRNTRRLLWFATAGVIGLVVDIGVLAALRQSLGVYGARVASFLVAATATWLINRRLTFTDRPADVGLLEEYLRYLGLMLGGGLVNFLVYSLLTWQLAQTPLRLSLYVCAGSLIGMAVNYLGASQWLYRQKVQQRLE